MAPSRNSRTASTMPDAAGPPSELSDEGLLLVTGEGLMTTFPLVRDEIVIGRASECDVPLAHQALSRRHAILRLGPPITVQDLGSTNGTRVLDEVRRGGAPMTIAVGETFHIGRLSLAVVRLPGARSRQSVVDSDALTVVDPTQPSPLVKDVALSAVNVLILGETGVGKEVLAETLHRESGRKGPLQRINCAALSGTLIESELFGHEKGAFTGATSSKPGLLEAAKEGTAFLDEVGELPLTLQAKLLRVIETRESLRVGAVKPIAIDVRFIAATNRDLPREVHVGNFRADLFFRLDGVTLAIPPLRTRRHLIVPLALDFLRAATTKLRPDESLRLHPEVLPKLQAHDWPGNVRELRAVCERAVLLARGGEIQPKHLTLTGAGATAARPATTTPPPPSPSERAPQLDDDETRERQRIIDALEACAGNQTRAAKRLGISRATLVTRLALYRIPRPRK